MLLSTRFYLAQKIIFSFLQIDPAMSLHAAVALMRDCREQIRKEPIWTSEPPRR